MHELFEIAGLFEQGGDEGEVVGELELWAAFVSFVLIGGKKGREEGRKESKNYIWSDILDKKEAASVDVCVCVSVYQEMCACGYDDR